ncbi:hypothetical protein Tco_1195682 [Tanacetum coccineum]
MVNLLNEAFVALLKWHDIQSKIDADHQLAKRLQAQEQEELSDAKKATLFQQLLEKSRKHFAVKRAEEKRNKLPIKAQQRQIICTYLKNMEGYKLKDLKSKGVGKRKRKESRRRADTREFKEAKVYADLHVGREEVSSYTTYTFNDAGKEASN